MTYRAWVAVLFNICVATAYPADAQDKRALVQKLIEVTELSNQIKVGAQTAAAPIMDQMRGDAGALVRHGKSPTIDNSRGAAAAWALAAAHAAPRIMDEGAQTRLLVAGGFVYMVNSWLMRDSLHWGLGRIAPRCLGSPQAPRMKGGPVLHLEHTRRGV
jgi:hypothetical protein